MRTGGSWLWETPGPPVPCSWPASMPILAVLILVFPVSSLKSLSLYQVSPMRSLPSEPQRGLCRVAPPLGPVLTATEAALAGAQGVQSCMGCSGYSWGQAGVLHTALTFPPWEHTQHLPTGESSSLSLSAHCCSPTMAPPTIIQPHAAWPPWANL